MMSQVIWSPGVKLSELERTVIVTAYNFYGKNKTATANSLGIAIRTLDSKLEKFAEDDAEMQKRFEERRAAREEFNRRERGIPSGAQYDTSATPSLHQKPTPPPPKTEVESPRTVATKGKGK